MIFGLQEESLNECEGSELYRDNIKHLETGIAKLKTPEGRNTIKVSKDKQKITDGTRPCWYGGARYRHQSRFFLVGQINETYGPEGPLQRCTISIFCYRFNINYSGSLLINTNFNFHINALCTSGVSKVATNAVLG